MENKLNDIVSVVGDYNEIATEINSNALVVVMINGLTVTKSADKMNWADGLLTFTVVINNETNETYKNPVISDILDTSLVTFEDGTVTIDGEVAEASKYTYDDVTGKLTINGNDVLASSTSTITFKVAKK